MKSWLQDNDMEIYSTHSEGESVVAERFIRVLKNKYASIWLQYQIHKLADIVDKKNNTYHSTIKIKPVEVKSNTYIYFNKENNKVDPRFKVDDYVRISKYKDVFAKVYVPNWSEEVFVIKKVNKLFCGGMW